MRLVAFLALVLAVCGCGRTHRQTVAGCLNERGFLVTAAAGGISGTSAGGTGLAVTLYPSAAAATRAAAKLGHRGTTVVGIAVVDVRGNPDASPPLTSSDLAAVRKCLPKRPA